MPTRISWADETWSPVTGCTKVSPGCAHCFIERTPPFRIAGRKFRRVGNEMTTGIQLHPERLDQPLRWRKPRRIFVCSMADLFHPDVPTVFIVRVFEIMAMAAQHTFLVLTKRPERMRTILSRGFDPPLSPWPLPNVHLGISAENQAMADLRIPDLLATPAAERWASLEPLIKPVDLTKLPAQYEGEKRPLLRLDSLRGGYWCGGGRFGPEGASLDGVVIGGESGPGYRDMPLEWARGVKRQCDAAKVRCYFKQASGPRPGMPSGDPELDGAKELP